MPKSSSYNGLAVYNALVERSPEIISHEEICKLAEIEIVNNAQIKLDGRDIIYSVRQKYDIDYRIINVTGKGYYFGQG